MSIITLTTDFGLRDGNVGVMKGVILGINPEAQIVDISHEIKPQDVRETNYVLERQVFYFPENTVHVVVVDPGVGTKRRPIAAQIGPQRFVGPDNGVFSLLYQRAERENWPVEILHLDDPKYWLKDVSHVFHGRDIFSPVGAYWAGGTALSDLGTPVNDPAHLPLPQVKRNSNGLQGEVVRIDHFGNIISNIHRRDVGDAEVAWVKVGEHICSGMVQTFGERGVGELVSLYSSIGYVILSEVNGSAAARLGLSLGDQFEVGFVA